MDAPHIPVLLDETLRLFQPVEEGVFVDCTLGYGGHAEAILASHPQLRYIGIDRDEEALTFSRKRLHPFADRVELLHGSFSQLLPDILSGRPVVGVLADFGVSSLQLDHTDRGFSFNSPTLDMRMDPSSGLSAYDVINRYPAEELERIFREYGEIREARRLADTIARRRLERPIETGPDLAELSASVLPKKGKTHPATRVFQAIRIEVNDELGEITRLLDTLQRQPPEGAIAGFITFHSLEDRLIKERLRAWSRECICPSDVIRCTCGGDHALGEILGKKGYSPSEKELRRNPRSRSARLRGFRFKQRS